MSAANLNPTGRVDPLRALEEAEEERRAEAARQEQQQRSGEVHIRVQQRNGRKCITTLQGLDPRCNFEKLNKEFKKRWGCSGVVVDDTSAGKVIQLQGDQRDHLKDFLVAEKLCKEEDLRIYGL